MNTKNLDTFLQLLKESRAKLNVGILGNNGTHNSKSNSQERLTIDAFSNRKPRKPKRRSESDGSPLTVAEIGAIHEFGKISDPSFPVRSFLRMPIAEKFFPALKSAGAFGPRAIEDVLKQKTFIPWLEKCGVVALAVIQDAFNTGGFGKWKPSDMRRKRNHQTLVETQQLRNSITYEVVDGK
jgi:hypothetical protein